MICFIPRLACSSLLFNFNRLQLVISPCEGVPPEYPVRHRDDWEGLALPSHSKAAPCHDAQNRSSRRRLGESGRYTRTCTCTCTCTPTFLRAIGDTRTCPLCVLGVCPTLNCDSRLNDGSNYFSITGERALLCTLQTMEKLAIKCWLCSSRKSENNFKTSIENNIFTLLRFDLATDLRLVRKLALYFLRCLFNRPFAYCNHYVIIKLRAKL